MTTFHDVRFPVEIARGARGGPRRRTQVVELYSGFEERNASWADSRREYDVGYGLRGADDLQKVVDFFESRNGRLHAFRFKDWSDYKSCLPSASVLSTDQILGVGDEVNQVFNLRKGYGPEPFRYWRFVTRPVVGTVKVSINDSEINVGWSVDYNTGVITFDSPPRAGEVVKAGYEYDVPARFDVDSIDVTLDFQQMGVIQSIPLKEVREK